MIYQTNLVMLRNTLLIAIISFTAQFAWSQPPGTVSAKLKAQAEAEKDPFKEKYENRVRKAELYGVYIPKDLADVFVQLKKLTDESSRTKFKAMNETDARQKLHFSLGRWMINNWGLYEGSRLSKYLNDIGLYEPDDMTRFLILTFHRELNKQPLQVKELIAEFQEIRRLEREKKLKEGTIIHQETRKRVVKEN